MQSAAGRAKPAESVELIEGRSTGEEVTIGKHLQDIISAVFTALCVARDWLETQ